MSLPTPHSSGFLRARRVLSLVDGVIGDAVWWLTPGDPGVGQAADVAAQVPRGTPVYDLADALVTPGFVDGHTHFALWARTGDGSSSQAAEDDASCAGGGPAAAPVQGWVIGQAGMPMGGCVPRTVPPWVLCTECPSISTPWTCTPRGSTALLWRRPGSTRLTADPFGGRIVRDAAGEPTGLLLERAVELMIPHLPVPPTARLDEALREAQGEAHRLGVTGIQTSSH